MDKSQGFTLVELTVTIGITVIISILILADFPEFTRRLALSRTAQAVAVSFREAESAALAVREFGSGIFPAYGIHFESPPLTSYVLFADTNNNRVYDGIGEKADEFTINGQPHVSRLCGGTKSAPPGRCDLVRLDVVFVRPNPDIYINSDKGSFSDAEAVILLPDGQEKKIIIWSTGQLSIE
ncbi:MAG: type II secretion system protein [Candidatus Niyogibacteria bacterium]|nr:type II secretion system protein [Candidatus Niyogibacteria bacterium]